MPERKYNPRQPAELRVHGVQLFKENRPDYFSDSAAYALIAETPGCSRFANGASRRSATPENARAGVPKKNGPQSIGKSRGGWNTKIRMVSASDRQAMIFRLSGGNAHDTPEGHALLERWAAPVADAPQAMDRTCEGNETRRLAEEMGMTPVLPPKANRKAERDYDQETYKFRNETERLFRRLERF